MKTLNAELLNIVSTADMMVMEDEHKVRLIWYLNEGTSSRKHALKKTNTEELLPWASNSVLDDDLWHLTFNQELLSAESISDIELL
jgi:hypothetical protein